MTNKLTASPNWSTASFGDGADSSPMELSALGEHMQKCQGLRGRLFTLRSGAEAMHGAVATRFVTTLAVVALLIGVALLVS
jgi:hypothetical protein